MYQPAPDDLMASFLAQANVLKNKVSMPAVLMALLPNQTYTSLTMAGQLAPMEIVSWVAPALLYPWMNRFLIAGYLVQVAASTVITVLSVRTLITVLEGPAPISCTPPFNVIPPPEKR